MAKEESIKEYSLESKSIDYIKENLHEELSLGKLASLSNFSKFHFHRIFKSVAGTTINEFITSKQSVKLPVTAVLIVYLLCIFPVVSLII
jgi:AraC-like DNA-binding protein